MLYQEPTPATADAPVLNPRCIRLRHDLRTFANNITGYTELVTLEAEEREVTTVAESLQELQRVAKLLVDYLSAFVSVPEGDNRLQYYRALESELLEYARRVLRQVERIWAEALEGGGEALLADLARIRRAATGLEQLAATIVRDSTLPNTPQREDAEVPALPVGESAAQSESAIQGRVLIIDDNEANRDMLSRILEREGLEVLRARGGREGLDILRAHPFDLVLLDLLMEDLDGISTLRLMKSDRELTYVSVVMLSAVDELPIVVACLEAGAEDYVTRPFNAVLLRSRVKMLLERKQFHDRERRKTAQLEAALAAVEVQKRISEQLLSNILPEPVARELQAKGKADPRYFEDVTIVQTDFVGFTRSTERLSADELVEVLNQYFTSFDRIVDRYGLEKLKTNGDSYVFASGLPDRSASHPVDAVLAAHEMLEVVRQMDGQTVDWEMRVGIHTGPVIAGIVGIRKFAFDVWGDTVNLTARMESAGAPNRLNLSERTYVRIKDFFACEHRGRIAIKEGRELDMYFADAINAKLLEDASSFPPPLFAQRYLTYFRKPLKAFPPHLAA